MSDRAAPEECAICGATIPRGAQACPECGADERTGWREQDLYDGLDLPASEPDSKPTADHSALFLKVIAVVLLVFMALLAFRHDW